MERKYFLHVKNYRNISDMVLDLSPGITGFVNEVNAIGKSNMMKSVEAILDARHDIRNIKDGCERSEIKLEEVENGEVIGWASRIQTLNGSRLEGKTRDKETPHKFITRLLDKNNLNSIGWVTENPVKYIKDNVYVKANKEDIPKNNYPDSPFNLENNAFHECDKQCEYYEKVRVDTYHDKRHVQEVISDLKKAVPMIPEKPQKKWDEIEKEKENIKAKINTIDLRNEHKIIAGSELEKIKTKNEDYKSKIAHYQDNCAHLKQKLNNANSEMANEIKKIQEKYAEIKNNINNQIDISKENEKNYIDRLEESLNDYNKKNSEYKEMPMLDKTKLESDLTKTISEEQEYKRFLEIKKQHDNIYNKELDLQKIEDKYKEEDNLYKYFAYDLPKKLIERCNLPIEGIEFRENELYVDNRLFSLLSDAEKKLAAVRLTIGIAEMKNKLAVGLDGVENLDKEHFKEFINSITDRGVRVFYSRLGKPEYPHEFEVIRGSIKNGESTE